MTKRQKKCSLDEDETTDESNGKWEEDYGNSLAIDDIDPFKDSSDKSDVDEESFFGICQPKVVEFESKKGKKYFIGKVTELDTNDTKVSFLKRGGDRNSYHEPNIPDISWVKTAAIKKILLQPQYRQRYFRFNISFPSVNIK